MGNTNYDQEFIENKIICFLLRSAIPKSQNEYAKDIVWDAVWRAHRDVLVARFNLKQYAALSKGRINPIVIDLYDHLRVAKSSNEISSGSLIDHLSSKFAGKVEYAAILKLVNMTLKYIYILQFFRVDDAVLCALPSIELSNCDCPLDSIILSCLPNCNKTKWTKLNEDGYREIQQAIGGITGQDAKLIFDLENWPDISLRAK